MNAKQIAATIAVALVGAAALTACSNEAPAPTPTDTVTSASSFPEPTETENSPTETTDEPTAPESEAPQVGTILDPASIEDARAAGANVFVSPTGDGSGVVVEPGYDLPEPVEQVVSGLPGGPTGSTRAEAAEGVQALVQMGTALEEAGLGVVVVFRGRVESGNTVTAGGYVVAPIGTAGSDITERADELFDSLAAAKAFAEKIAAPVGAEVIVLD